MFSNPDLRREFLKQLPKIIDPRKNQLTEKKSELDQPSGAPKRSPEKPRSLSLSGRQQTDSQTTYI